MRLRRRLIATMIVLMALGLVAVDVITLTSLHSYLYGRVDAQLNAATRLSVPFLARAEARGVVVGRGAIQSRVSPDIYVAILGSNGAVMVERPSRTSDQVDPPPRLPTPLPVRPAPDPDSSRG